MPRKRRATKRKTAYPEVVQKVVDGESIEPSPEAREELIAFAFFGWSEYPDLPRTVFDRALAIVRGWDA